MSDADLSDTELLELLVMAAEGYRDATDSRYRDLNLTECDTLLDEMLRRRGAHAPA